MKNYQGSDYALNKHSKAIVYSFADSIVGSVIPFGSLFTGIMILLGYALYYFLLLALGLRKRSFRNKNLKKVEFTASFKADSKVSMRS